MEFEIYPPIVLENGNVDLEKIGKSESLLHKIRYGGDYKNQGYSGVSVRYVTEKQDDGSAIIRLFVNVSK